MCQSIKHFNLWQFLLSRTLHISLLRGGKKPVWLDSPWITARRSSCCVSATMFSLQLCDLKWQQQRHQNRRSRRLLGPKWASPAHSGIWARANRRGEKEQTRPLRGERLQAHHTFPALPGSPEKQEHKRRWLKTRRGEITAWQGPKLARCRAKSSCDPWSTDFGQVWRRRRIATRRLRAQLRRERAAGPLPPSTSSPPGPAPAPTSPVPCPLARPASLALVPTRPTLPPHVLLARLSGPPPGSAWAGGRSSPRRPRPGPGTHFLNPLQRHGSGRAAGTPAGGRRLRALGRAVVAGSAAGGSARWLLGWLSPVGPRLAARWLAPGAGACSVCARARVCASVRGGTPARLFCFRFCFWEGACALPAPPRSAWHAGKCSSNPLLGRRPPGADLAPAACA